MSINEYYFRDTLDSFNLKFTLLERNKSYYVMKLWLKVHFKIVTPGTGFIQGKNASEHINLFQVKYRIHVFVQLY